MKFALVFFALAALFFWAGSAVPSGSIFAFGFYWAAAAELVTGSLYLAAALFDVSPGRLFKSADGRTRTAIRLVTWPYLLFEIGLFRRYLRKSREPRFEPVAEGVYIGSRVMAQDLAALRQEGISATLDLVAEFPAPNNLLDDPGIVYLCLPVIDGTAPSSRDLEAAVAFVALARRAGRRTLVHCAFGHGRSAMVIACALIRLGLAETGEQALDLLKKCRRKIWLSREQIILLEKFQQSERERARSAGPYSP